MPNDNKPEQAENALHRLRVNAVESHTSKDLEILGFELYELRQKLAEAQKEIEHQKDGRIIAENDRTQAIQHLFKAALAAGWKEYIEKGGDFTPEAWSPSGEFHLIDDIAEQLPEEITKLRAELAAMKQKDL